MMNTSTDMAHPVPEIDVDEIMQVIRLHQQTKQATDSVQAVDLAALERSIHPETGAKAENYPLIYYLLRELKRNETTQAQLEPDLMPSRLSRLPMIGLLWNHLRRHLHGLPIFYVRRLANQMTASQRILVTILNFTVQQNQRQAVELAELRQKVADLETQLAQAEQLG